MAIYLNINFCDICIDFQFQNSIFWQKKILFWMGCEQHPPLLQCVQLKCKSAFIFHFSFLFMVATSVFGNLPKLKYIRKEILNSFYSLCLLNYQYKWCDVSRSQTVHVNFQLCFNIFSEVEYSNVSQFALNHSVLWYIVLWPMYGDVYCIVKSLQP